MNRGQAPPERIAKELAAFDRDTDAQCVEIWPRHWRVAELFFSLSTQWRRSEMNGQLIGLDYAGVEITARLRGWRLTPRMFADLQAIETAAIEEDGKRADEARRKADAERRRRGGRR